jgi:hypothetical protein
MANPIFILCIFTLLGIFCVYLFSSLHKMKKEANKRMKIIASNMQKTIGVSV